MYGETLRFKFKKPFNHLHLTNRKNGATLIMELNIIWFRSFSSKETVHCFIDEESSSTIRYLFLFDEIQIANSLNVSWPIMTNIKHCESVYIKRESDFKSRSVSLRETQKQDKRKQLAFWISQLCTSSQKNIGQRVFRKPTLELTALLACAIKWGITPHL